MDARLANIEQAAMEAARAAYQDENFPKARDLAQKASETDPDNTSPQLILSPATPRPELHWLLVPFRY